MKGDRLWLDCPGVAEPLGAKLTDLQGLSVPNRAKPVADGEDTSGSLGNGGRSAARLSC